MRRLPLLLSLFLLSVLVACGGAAGLAEEEEREEMYVEEGKDTSHPQEAHVEREKVKMKENEMEKERVEERESEEESGDEIWAVQLKEGVDAESVAEMWGAELIGLSPPFEDTFLFRLKRDDPAESRFSRDMHPHSPFARTPLPQSSASIQHLWSEKQTFRWRHTRSLSLPPSDPYYLKQWHLSLLNVSSMWEKGYTGRNVQIAIVDDGLQWMNPDLIDQYSSRGSIDLNGHSVDPSPPYTDSHGTASAAVASASMNNWCGVGVAPESRVSGIRILGDKVSDAQEAEALSYRYDLNAIYSNSWGPTDDGLRLEGPGLCDAFLSLSFGR